MDSSFLIGPAIDEAASNMEAANCSAVWLSQSAADVAEKHLVANHPVIFRSSIPLKNGQTPECFVINPLSLLEQEDDINKIRNSLLHPMKSVRDDGVRKKLQHTTRLLDEAERCLRGNPHWKNLLHQP